MGNSNPAIRHPLSSGNTGWTWRICTILIIFCCLIDLCDSFNPHVDSYETLNYRPVLDRRKRSLDGTNVDRPVTLRFYSHKRPFNLKLFPANDVFTDDFQVDVDDRHIGGEVQPTNFIYDGYVEGDGSSKVYGSILDGIFEGHVIFGDGRSFTVERAAKHFEPSRRPTTYHSFIYDDAEINYRKYVRERRSADTNYSGDDPEAGCGLTDDVRRQMRRVVESAVPTAGDDAALGIEFPIAGGSSALTSIMHLYDDIASDEMTHFNRTLNGSRARARRDVPRSRNEFKNINGRQLYGVRTCTMYLQSDQKLYEAIYFKEGNQNHIRTREEIVSLFYNHIKAVNQIYESTDFGGVHGLNFVIQRTSIYTKETCLNGKPVPGSDNPFCEENVDVSNYLNMNSQRNHSAFCLAYAMTFRDFIGGTLGLAWVASPTFSTAGICQMYQKYNEGQQGTVYRSLNTGIVTLVNYGNRVPLRVSQLTMAHEIGHNFGAPHDHTSECQPGLPDGNYIMFASATSGDKVNNAKFSRCSITAISQVLYEVLQQPPIDAHHLAMPLYGKKRNCFQERTSAFCGNQIHEPSEQCDCGFSQRDCDEMGDKCCAPRESAGGCRRTPGSLCSPSEGLCCDSSSCSFYKASARIMCREESECLLSQRCNGTSPACPDSEPKPDGLPCQDVTKVCHAGSCNGSICEEVGLKDCFLTEGKPSQLCHLACEKNGTCFSSFELLEFAIGKFKQKSRENQPGLLLHPGSPCNNYKGYCDILRKCRSVDSNGPLARLKNLLFSKHTIKTVSQWVQEHWWACVVGGIFVLLFMALFVKCCAVHTPSTNPNKLPAQNFSDTLRHPGTLLRRGRGTPRGASAAYSVGRTEGTAQLNSVASVGRNAAPTLRGVLANGHGRGGGRRGGGGRHPSQQRHKEHRNHARRQHPNRRRSSSSQNQQQQPAAGSSAVATSRHQYHGVANRAPSNLSAPPLISSFAVPSVPPPPVFPAMHEPPPPYTLTDPAAIAVPSTSSGDGDDSGGVDGAKNNAIAVTDSTSTSALIAGGVPPPVPVSLPGPPSAVPLALGPPMPGQGPRPGRRRPKPAAKDGPKKKSNK